MNKKIVSVIRKGPVYMIKKLVCKTDSVYRKIRRKLYLLSCKKENRPSDKKGFISCTIASEKLKSAEFIEQIKNTDYYTSIDSYADACGCNKMLLFGRWTAIPLIDGNYPWNTDFVHNHTYKNIQYMSTPASENGSEVKVPWELGRMQQLPIVALAWLVTDGSGHLSTLRWIINNFNSTVKVGYGVQWVCSMEVAIRIFNIVTAYSMIANNLPANDPLHATVYKMACDHAKYLMNNLETSAHLFANNHYLADLLGIVSAASSFNIPSRKRLLRFARRELEREIRRQITKDGMNYEMSIAYTRLDAEMFLYSAIMLDRAGMPVSSYYKTVLLRISTFLKQTRMGETDSVQLGDNDSGRILILTPGSSRYYSYISELIDMYCTGKAEESVFNTELLAVLGEINAEKTATLEGIHLFSDTKVACVHKKEYSLLFANTGANKYELNGHKHNDNLSFELYVKGRPIIVDPGTGCYTSDPDTHNALRSDTAHNTFYVAGKEFNHMRGVFGLDMNLCHTDMIAEKDSIIAGHDAYLTRFGFLCFRSIECRENEIIITDTIGKSENSRQNALEWNFTLHPDVRVVRDMDPATLTLVTRKVKVRLKSCLPLTVTDGLYSPEYMSVIHTKCIRASGNSQNANVFTLTIEKEY